ncbi:MAG: trypsin-like serine protease [Candidatus Latescibacterota bacterium]|nr:MAG: trypsin-like serine protease [Candidatus Latescibacterota bacterium]
MRRAVPFCCVLLALILADPRDAGAIVVRHDADDADYVALGSRYPAGVSVLPDGSGALVAPRFVLTAAHVAHGVANRFPRVEIEGTEYEVERVFLHPDWMGRGAHDLALLRLKRGAADVACAALYRQNDEVGRVITFVGRGDTGTGTTGPMSVDRKKRGATNRIDAADADWIYFTFDAGAEATALEGVSGPGDSGGPAFAEMDGVLYVLGVSVFSFNGKPGRYGTREAYTRVSTHADWIDSIVAGTSEEPGFAPGDAQQNPAERGVVRRAPTDLELSDISGGNVIAGYLQAYNSASDERMLDFLDQNFAASYLDAKTEKQHMASYHRMLDDELGRLELKGVVEASSTSVVVRVTSEKGAEAELHFTLDGNERIERLVVAKIDAVRR